MANRRSIIQYYGPQEKNRCGYCKGARGCYSHSMHGHLLHVEDYQSLIDRGWRRSGTYCYKPTNSTTCCPAYTIRCDVNEFKLSKSQRKTIKKFNKYLTDGVKPNAGGGEGGGGADDDVFNDQMTECFESKLCANNVQKKRHIDLSKIDLPKRDDSSKILRKVNDLKESSSSSSSSHTVETKQINSNKLLISQNAADSNSHEVKKGDGPDTNKPLCKKAKFMRLQRKAEKLGTTIDDVCSGSNPAADQKKINKNIEKTLDMLLNEIPENSLHKLELKLIPSKSEEFQLTCMEEFELYTKYQMTIHNDKRGEIDSFLNFLVRSPLSGLHTRNGPTMGYGSFHQQYRIDGKLIAVAVLDILPASLSSVYLFYDPDYNFLSLGTYAALREIHFVQTLKIPELHQYYMGFYIHSCPKMRYKGKYKPSYILCPEVYSWHLLDDEIVNRLNTKKYQRFNGDPAAIDLNQFNRNDLANVKIFDLETYTAVNYGSNKKLFKESLLYEYGTMVGKRLTQHLWAFSE